MKFKMLSLLLCLSCVQLSYGTNKEGKEEQEKASDTPLITAVKENDKDKVNMLLSSGANPNIKGRNGFTALMVTARKQDTKENYAMAEELLRKKADPNITNNDGFSAFLLAISLNHYNLAKLLLENGGSLSSLETEQGKTALQMLDASKDNQKLKALISQDLIQKRVTPPGGKAVYSTLDESLL